MEPNIPRLHGETDLQYEKRCVALRYLGKRWLLAEPIKKPKDVLWKG